MAAGVSVLAASPAVGVSVPPHVVPAHRDHGTLGPETVDDGRCPALFRAPLRPSGFRSIQRANNTPKTPPRRHHEGNRDFSQDFSTVAGAACEFVVFPKRAY
uniref:Putative secreted protein n=1 Tax=Ixodes ricinus TaxID=34613 RepID=A0A6B0UF69_IXORI